MQPSIQGGAGFDGRWLGTFLVPCNAGSWCIKEGITCTLKEDADLNLPTAAWDTDIGPTSQIATWLGDAS